MTCLFTSDLTLEWIARYGEEGGSESAPGRNKTPPLLVFLIDFLFALLLLDFYWGTMDSLTMACKVKGKVVKQKLSFPCLLDYRCILRQINFRKTFEYLGIDSLKNIWFYKLELEDNIIKPIKIRRTKIFNSLGPFSVLVISFNSLNMFQRFQ